MHEFIHKSCWDHSPGCDQKLTIEQSTERPTVSPHIKQERALWPMMFMSNMIHGFKLTLNNYGGWNIIYLLPWWIGTVRNKASKHIILGSHFPVWSELKIPHHMNFPNSHHLYFVKFWIFLFINNFLLSPSSRSFVHLQWPGVYNCGLEMKLINTNPILSVSETPFNKSQFNYKLDCCRNSDSNGC